MGGLFKSSKQKAESQQQVTLPPWLSADLQGQSAQANALSQSPFASFGGQRVAGITNTQNQAAAGTAGLTGYQPMQVAPGSIAGGNIFGNGAGSTLADANLSRYMDPYMQSVIGTTMGEIDRNTAKTLSANKGAAAQAGAFGGDRAALVDTETQRNAADLKARTAAGLMSQAYGQAQQGAQYDITNRNANATTQAGFDQQTQLANMQAGQQAQLANQSAGLQGAQFNLGALTQLYGMGQQEQATGQAGLDAQYEEFLRGINDPYQKLQFASGITNGLTPAFAGTQTNTTQPGPSLGAQLLGFGMGSSSIARNLQPRANGGVIDGEAEEIHEPADAGLQQALALLEPVGFARGGEVADRGADVAGVGLPVEALDEPELLRLAALLPDVAKRRDALMDAYPGLRVTSESRGPSRDSRVQNSQHTHDRAFDVDIGAVPEDKRPAMVRDLTGGRFGAVGGLGMYGAEKPNMLHVDYRPGTRAAWGPNRSHTSLDQTPGYFRDAVGSWRGRPAGVQMATAGNVATDAPASRPGDPVAVELPRQSAGASPAAGLSGGDAPAPDDRLGPMIEALVARGGIRDPEAEAREDAEFRKRAAWDAIGRAGFGMMASRSPTFLGGVGEGMLVGSKAYEDMLSSQAARRDKRADRTNQAVGNLLRIKEGRDARTDRLAESRENRMARSEQAAATLEEKVRNNMATAEERAQLRKLQEQIAADRLEEQRLVREGRERDAATNRDANQPEVVKLQRQRQALVDGGAAEDDPRVKELSGRIQRLNAAPDSNGSQPEIVKLQESLAALPPDSPNRPALEARIRLLSERPEKPPRPLTDGARTNLSGVGGAVSQASSLRSGFRDDFGGFGFAGAGDVANWTARNFAAGGKGGEDRAAWWQEYQTRKNAIRNQLFGSALTKTEREEWEKADINPGMTPAMIKRNLARQEQAARSAARRLAESYGVDYNRDSVEAALGMKLDDLGKPIEIPAEEPPIARGRGAGRPTARSAPASNATPTSNPAPGPDIPARPASVPDGSAYSPSRRQWRDTQGKLYNADGSAAE